MMAMKRANEIKSAAPDSIMILQSPESIKTEYIPLKDLYFAEVKTRKNAKYIGLGIGLLIDLAMVAAAYVKATDTLKRIPYEVATSVKGG